MAGATIDNINIVATADVSSAIKSLDKLQEKLSGLKGAATKAAPAVKSTEKSVDDAGKTSEKTTKSVSKLAAALKRVLVYRALRAAIKNIAQAFNEGVKNAYAWADANNDAFKQVMDTYATRTAYLKNSLGAVASTVLTALLPAFMTITDLLIKGINYVNEFIAAIKGALTGDYSYLKAKEVAVEFAESTDDAAKAQKRLNQQLMAFDELNVITTPRDTARGSGDAGKWDDAFERTEVSDWMKNNWGWVGAIGLGSMVLVPMLTNWIGGALSAAVTNAMLGGGGQVGLASLLMSAVKLVGGVALAVGGVSLALDAARSFLDGDNVKGFVEMVAGALATGLGGALIGSTFGASGLGFVIGAGLSLAVTLLGIEVERPKTPLEDAIWKGAYVDPNGGALNIKRRGNGLGIGPVGNSTNGAKNINYTGSRDAATQAIKGNYGKVLTPDKYGISWLAEGGYPSMGSVFVAGEVPGAAEFVGNINGRTGVASGEEITGISEAVYSTGGETNALLRELIAVSSGGTNRPSAAFGKFVSQSLNLYKGVTG